MLVNYGLFVVTGKTGRKYAVALGRYYNIIVLTWLARRYCGTFPGLPLCDCLLAQKLWLEADDDGFARQANWEACNGAWNFDGISANGRAHIQVHVFARPVDFLVGASNAVSIVNTTTGMEEEL